MKLTTAFATLTLVTLSGTARADPAADPTTAELYDLHRHHQHGGITQFVELSLDTLGEDDTQRPVVEKIQDELHDCMEAVENQERLVILAIADGVAGGKVDPSQVKAGVEKLRAAAEPLHGCVDDPLNRLHAALSAPERAELADKTRAHWSVWRTVHHDSKLGGREADGWLAELSDELKLSSAQTEKISVALDAATKARTEDDFDVEKSVAQVKSFATAFAGETFNAKSVNTGSTAFLSSHGMLRMGLFYETVALLLTPDQRATLAAHLREHANHHAQVANQ